MSKEEACIKSREILSELETLLVGKGQITERNLVGIT